MKKYFIFFFLLSLTLLSAEINFYDNDINKIHRDLAPKTTMQKILLLDQYIHNNPELYDLYLYKAQLEFSMKDFIGVEKTLSAHLKNDFFTAPQWKNAAYMLGMSFYHRGEMKKASVIFQEIQKKSPEDSTATFFLSLLPKSENNFSTKEYIDTEYIRTLNRDYSSENQKEIGNYLYLLHKKSLSILKSNLFNYVQEGAIKVNNLDDQNLLRNFPIPFDSTRFQTGIAEALLIQPDGNIIKIEQKDIYIQDSQNQTKNVVIKYNEIQKGSILCYRIAFSGLSNPQTPQPDISDIFYVASGIQTYKKIYTVNFPSELGFYLIPEGLNDFLPEETTERGITTFTYTYTNPEILQLSPLENVCLFDISPKIILTSYSNWNDFGKWFAPQYFSMINQSLANDSEILSNLSGSKLDRLQAIYHYMQKNINLSGENTFLPKQSPSEILKNRNGTIAEQNALLINALKTQGIISFPMLISSINNGQPAADIPAPCAFNHMITYVPPQKDIEQEFYLDPGTKFTAYNNLPFQLQSTGALIIQENGSTEFVSTPVIPAQLNCMTEDYVVNINNIGQANVKLSQKISGSFAEYFHTQLAESNGGQATKEQRENYFFKIQKEAFPDLKPEQMIFKEDNSYSGNFNLVVDTTANNVTELLLDGKQVLNFQLGDLGEWLSMPPEAQYPFRKDFAFLFQKKMDCQFPEGYQIADHNLQNIFKENNYFLFRFNAEKVADNHFILESEIRLKETTIQPEEISYLNQYIGLLLQSLQFRIVMENPKIDYETFFDPLLKQYHQPDIYKNYLSRLFAVKKMDKAEKVAIDAVQQFPEDNYFSLVLAMINYEQGKYEESRNELLKLLEKTPDDAVVYEYLAQLYRQTGDNQSYLEILLKAHEKFPKEISFLNSLVEFYRKNDQLDKAIELLETVLQKEEADSNIHADLGYLYSIAKKFDKANSHLHRAIELNEQNSYALNNLAWLYCENAIQLEEAVELAQKACQLEPENDNFLDTLAEAYYQTCQYEKAEEIIKKAIKINPNYNYLQMQLKKIRDAANALDEGKNSGE